ncbi:hypothetical protein pb186bvf_008679 [Paramecium bursaria]
MQNQSQQLAEQKNSLQKISELNQTRYLRLIQEYLENEEKLKSLSNYQFCCKIHYKMAEEKPIRKFVKIQQSLEDNMEDNLDK